MANQIRKVNSKTFTEEEKSINKITSNFVLVGKHRKFTNYSIDSTGIIFADGSLENEKDFFNATDVLTSIVGIGKRCHSIFRNELIEISNTKNLKNKKTTDDEIKFIDFNELNNNTVLTNTFIDTFIPYSIFISHIEELKPLLLEFCEKNGMPYVQDDFGEVIDGKYYSPNICNTRPFVSLSIITYILFETQDIIKKIIENANKEPTTDNSTIGYIVDTKNYGWNENDPNVYSKRLKPILWFFFGSEDIDLKNVDVYYLANSITRYCQKIENETSYIKFNSIPKFFLSKNRYGIEEKHENLLSVAWSKLKITMYANNARACKNPNCNNIFEPSYPRQESCEECLGNGYNKNVNSNKSYQKKQDLHKKLVELYNSTKKSKLKKLDIEIINDIEEYVSYKKASIIKKETDIETIEKYINILSNLI